MGCNESASIYRGLSDIRFGATKSAYVILIGLMWTAMRVPLYTGLLNIHEIIVYLIFVTCDEVHHVFLMSSIQAAMRVPLYTGLSDLRFVQ